MNHNIFDDVFDQFVNKIAQTIDKHAPLERMLRKQQKLAKKVCVTKGILSSIRKKSAMFQTHFIAVNTVDISFFRRYSNMLTKIKSLSKKIYYYSELSEIVNCNVSKTLQVVGDRLRNIANKRTMRVVSRCVVPTLSRVRALKEQIVSVLTAIQSVFRVQRELHHITFTNWFEYLVICWR